MKTIFKAVVCTMCCGFFSSVGFAQKENSKMNKNEEIIIRKNDASPGKTIIVIDSNNITVNGKPLSDYHGDVTVLKRNFMGDNNKFFDFPQGTMHLLSNSNTAFLGVLTAKTDKGAVIKTVIDSSAAKKAGLQKEDVITKFGDKEIYSPEDLRNAVESYKPGDEVTISYLRDGKSESAKVELGKTPSNVGSYPMPDLNDLMNGMNRQNFDFQMPQNHFRFNSNTPKLGLKIEDTDAGNGAKILEVQPGSAADKAGLKKGDIITEMNGEKVNGVSDVRTEIMSSADKNDYKIKVKRDTNEKTFEVKIPKVLKSINI
jgi:serine protease Do